MNILFFLIPKSKIVYVEKSNTLRQVIEKLDYHKYSAVPILDENGRYVGTVSEGDLFWYIKEYGDLNYHVSEEINILSVPRRREYKAIRYDSSMDELLQLAMGQNFVPVLDDHDVFMGIVTRKAIIEYFTEADTNK